jgi:hypothetical protein
MKKKLILILCLGIALIPVIFGIIYGVGLFIAHKGNPHFIKIDRCLDRGGTWNYTENYCYGEKNATYLITLKYSLNPFRTFEIVGTDIKGIELVNLTEALEKHKNKNPQAEYELLAEVKSAPETMEEIKKSIERSGIKLKHCWVPTSIFSSDKPGPYGPGFIDIINENKNL